MKTVNREALSLMKKAKALLFREIGTEKPDPDAVLAFTRTVVTQGARVHLLDDHDPWSLVARAKESQKLLKLFPSPKNEMEDTTYDRDVFLETKKFLWRTLLAGFHDVDENHEKTCLELGLALMELSIFSDEREALEGVFVEYYRGPGSQPYHRRNIAKLLPHCRGYHATVAFKYMFIFLLDHPNAEYMNELIRFSDA